MVRPCATRDMESFCTFRSLAKSVLPSANNRGNHELALTQSLVLFEKKWRHNNGIKATHSYCFGKFYLIKNHTKTGKNTELVDFHSLINPAFNVQRNRSPNWWLLQGTIDRCIRRPVDHHCHRYLDKHQLLPYQALHTAWSRRSC